MEPTLSSKPKRDLCFWCFLLGRAVGMLAVVLTIPLTHAAMSKFYHRTGQQEFLKTITSMMDGIIAAIIYLVIATVAHMVVQKRSQRTKWWTEGLVLGFFIFLLVYQNL